MERFVFADEHNCDRTYVLYADAQATVEALQKKYDHLLGKYRQLMDFYDKHNGTPCEQIRHQQQVEALQRERDTARRRVDELEAREVDVVLLRGDLDDEREKVAALQRERQHAEQKHLQDVTYMRSQYDSIVKIKDDVQAALDAEREKVKGLEDKLDLFLSAEHIMTVSWKGKVADRDKQLADLQAQLSQLQALVRAKEAAYEKILLSRERLEREVRGYPPVDNEGIPMVWEEPVGWVKRTLDATTPAPETSIIGKCEPPSQWNPNAQVRGDIS